MVPDVVNHFTPEAAALTIQILTGVRLLGDKGCLTQS